MREKSVKRTFDKARAAARKAVSKLPASTVRGFHDGRASGRNFVENAPHVAGAVVGFTVGADRGRRRRTGRAGWQPSWLGQIARLRRVVGQSYASTATHGRKAPAFRAVGDVQQSQPA